MIKKIDKKFIDLIKSSIIINDPSSVIKELVENSLDAWSNTIKIYIKDGWKKYIKVEDDWIWMDAKDLYLCVDEYTSSKIYNSINNITTYWFRWEWLYAIWKFSKLRIISKTKNLNFANELVYIEWKKSIKPTYFDRVQWTTVIVEDLFYNDIEKYSFLWNTKYEFNKVKNKLIKYVLISDAAFYFYSDNQLIFNIYWDRIDKIQELFKIKVEFIKKEFEYWYLNLYLWPFTDLKFDNLFIYINKRPIEDRFLKKIILDSLWLINEKLSFMLLDINIPNYFIDLTIDPKKEKINFLNNDIYNKIHNIIKDIFSKPRYFDINNNQYLFDKDNFRYLTTLFWKYILFEWKDWLYVLDYHAFHEKYLFFEIKNNLFNSEIVKLLTPIIIDKINIETLEYLKSIWFEIEKFWFNKYIIYSIPKIFIDLEIDINLILWESIKDFNDLFNYIIAKKACKKAYKAWDKLTEYDINYIIEKLIDFNNQFICPHWRPFLIKIDKNYFDSLFWR